jgi:hypothetical protein
VIRHFVEARVMADAASAYRRASSRASPRSSSAEWNSAAPRRRGHAALVPEKFDLWPTPGITGKSLISADFGAIRGNLIGADPFARSMDIH